MIQRSPAKSNDKTCHKNLAFYFSGHLHLGWLFIRLHQQPDTSCHSFPATRLWLISHLTTLPLLLNFLLKLVPAKKKFWAILSHWSICLVLKKPRENVVRLNHVAWQTCYGWNYCVNFNDWEQLLWTLLPALFIEQNLADNSVCVCTNLCKIFSRKVSDMASDWWKARYMHQNLFKLVPWTYI